ncbi:MAG: hypothetical protein ACTHKF_10140 [Candidatus Nitrosocosmicus sp.]
MSVTQRIEKFSIIESIKEIAYRFGDLIINQDTLRIEKEQMLRLSFIDHGYNTIFMIF